MTVEPVPIAFPELLRATAREIDKARQAILAAEHHIAPVLEIGAGADGSAQDLQQIDLALQILADIEEFMIRLGESQSSNLVIDAGHALDGLKLESVVAGLGTSLRSPLASVPPSLPLVELF